MQIHMYITIQIFSFHFSMPTVSTVDTSVLERLNDGLLSCKILMQKKQHYQYFVEVRSICCRGEVNMLR